MKVLYTDIDGTLTGPLGNLFWDSERNTTPAAADAIVRAARAGLEIVPVTGRSRAGMLELARLLGFPHWFGELGGLRIYDRGEQVVVDHGGEVDGTLIIEELRRALRGMLERFPGRIEEHAPWNESRIVSLVLRGGLGLEEAGAFLAEAGLDWATFVDNGVIPRRYESMPEVERVHAYHLVPRGVSKAAAIAADREHRGLAREDCAMVGDSRADVECAPEVARCFLVRNGYAKDPGLAWTG
ncbi:MAG: HAD family hydrolase, partial [Gemmatimonadales bacterium]